MTPRRIVLAILALGALAFGLERVIVTDREAVTALLESAAAAVSHNDWDALARTIDDEYSERGKDKAAFVAWVRGLAQRFQPQGVGIDVTEPTIDGDRAAARVMVKPGAPYIGQRIAGRVDLVRRSDGWRITSVASDDLSGIGR